MLSFANFSTPVASTTTSNPYGLSSFNFFHCDSGAFRSSSIYSSAALIFFAMSILMPLLAAMTTRDAPLSFKSWARIKPVGPAPKSNTSIPTGGFSLSSPWMAHAAGSSRVDSSSVRLWILYNFFCWLNWSDSNEDLKLSFLKAYYLMYSANPPSWVTPQAWKFSHSKDCPLRQ